MRDYLVIFTAFAMIGVMLLSTASCEGQPPTIEDQYEIGYKKMVPPENVDKMADFITKTVSASNLHMTGGDYEDPEDVVEAAERTAKNLYEVEVEGLYYKYQKEYSWEWAFTPKDSLKYRELEIFKKLKGIR